MKPERRLLAVALHDQDQGHDNVTDGEDREIGRRIVGAIWFERLVAGRAVALHLEETAEQGALAAAGAASGPAAQQSGPEFDRGVILIVAH